MRTRNRKQGFTLVEILIVVVILGILAAIVIPQFTNASESAKASSLVSQLQTIRSQLELYQVQHNGNYPDFTNQGWAQLTNKTDRSGTVMPAGTTTPDAYPFGPYLQEAPMNPFEGSAAVIVDGTPAAGSGWRFTTSDNDIEAIIAGSKASEVALDDQPNDVATY